MFALRAKYRFLSFMSNFHHFMNTKSGLVRVSDLKPRVGSGLGSYGVGSGRVSGPEKISGRVSGRPDSLSGRVGS